MVAGQGQALQVAGHLKFTYQEWLGRVADVNQAQAVIGDKVGPAAYYYRLPDITDPVEITNFQRGRCQANIKNGTMATSV